MQFNIETPTKAFLTDYSDTDLEKLKKDLTYTNTAASYDVKRHYSNTNWRRRDPEGWEAKLAEFQSKVKNTLVFEEDGRPYIRTSSLNYLPDVIHSDRPYRLPVPKKKQWRVPLPFDLHPYQAESVELLLKEVHGNVEITTGAGKTAIILCLCQRTSFRTAIVAPSASIFNELLAKFQLHFGPAFVGAFGDGKKQIGKLFTICMDDSLTNVEPGSEEWEFFSNLDMMIVDESHTWGAETLEKLSHGIFGNIPYRFFMSATQTRGDGGVKLLQSIIGRTVLTLTTEEAVAGGYICPHDFTIIELESSNPNYNSANPLEMKRIHFLNNKNIAAFAAKLANAEATTHRRQTLILVEELPQIAMILKLLKVPTAYAHSSTDKRTLSKLGLEKVDSAEAVERFNKAEVMVLVGTSCIATGTNIYPTHNAVNWVGGASEIRTKQGAVGRSVRLHEHNPYRENCVEKRLARIWDFDVRDIDIMRRHTDDRISFYHDSGSEIKRIKLNVQKIQAGGVR